MIPSVLALALTCAQPPPGRELPSLLTAVGPSPPAGRSPRGHNYGNAGRLLDDFWDAEWPIVEADFQALKALEANVIRVHLQVNKFLTAVDRPNPAALDRLGKLLDLAERTGLYLDITGLGCYRPADTPAWHDVLSEADQWTAQGR